MTEILSDPEKMLYNELVYAFDKSLCLYDQLRDDTLLTVRPNYGTGIIASLAVLGLKLQPTSKG